jgi:hypothetical protein
MSKLMACLALSPCASSGFDELLTANPELHRVSFYRLTCKAHGVFRVLANGSIPDRCPRCSQPAQLQRARNLLCATRLPVPLVRRWKGDNHEGRGPNIPWFRQDEIEEC